MLVKMTVAGLAVEPSAGTPVVLLRDASGDITVPIWIGQTEALAIASEMEGVRPPRPMTHDLLRNVIHHLGFRVARVVVNDLKDNTFFAVVNLVKGDQEIEVDSRPSDAIALALRAGAPIFVHSKVIEALRREQEEREAKEQEEADPEQEKVVRVRRGRGEGKHLPRTRENASPLQKPSTAKESSDEWEKLLRSMKPEDFGKYRH